MAFFCFLVDQRRSVRGSKPTAGLCARCGGGASVAEVETATRFCGVPLHRRCGKAIICTFCDSVLKTYQREFLKTYRKRT